MWSCLPFFHNDLVELRFLRSPGDLDAVRGQEPEVLHKDAQVHYSNLCGPFLVVESEANKEFMV